MDVLVNLCHYSVTECGREKRRYVFRKLCERHMHLEDALAISLLIGIILDLEVELKREEVKQKV